MTHSCFFEIPRRGVCLVGNSFSAYTCLIGACFLMDISVRGVDFWWDLRSANIEGLIILIQNCAGEGRFGKCLEEILIESVPDWWDDCCLIEAFIYIFIRLCVTSVGGCTGEEFIFFSKYNLGWVCTSEKCTLKGKSMERNVCTMLNESVVSIIRL